MQITFRFNKRKNAKTQRRKDAKKDIKFLFASLRLCVFAFLFLFSSCHKKKVEMKVPTYPIEIGVAVQKPAPIFIETLGHIESITSIQIKSRIEGELTGIFFKQGQEVKKGDLLFTIDPKPYQAALKQARGLLEETLANLSLAEEKVKRFRTLAKDEYYSQIDYETLQVNQAALQAQAMQYEGEVEKAAIDLDYCWIYAPIDGKTGILQIDYGNLIAQDSDTPLVTLNQMAPIFVTFSLPEFELQRVRKYQKMNDLKILAAFDTFDQETFEGTLYMVDNEVDQKTGMIKIRAMFQNEGRWFWPGQFIRTRLVLTTLPNATVIPYAAVQLTPAGPIVFSLKEDMTVVQKSVKLGQREDDQIVVLEGLSPGEKIVTDGQINLSNGAKVFLPEAPK